MCRNVTPCGVVSDFLKVFTSNCYLKGCVLHEKPPMLSLANLIHCTSFVYLVICHYSRTNFLWIHAWSSDQIQPETASYLCCSSLTSMLHCNWSFPCTPRFLLLMEPCTIFLVFITEIWYLFLVCCPSSSVLISIGTSTLTWVQIATTPSMCYLLGSDWFLPTLEGYVSSLL